jgi:hypothetical protein
MSSPFALWCALGVSKSGPLMAIRISPSASRRKQSGGDDEVDRI